MPLRAMALTARSLRARPLLEARQSGPMQLAAIRAITGIAAVGGTLTAGATTPSRATVAYQWLWSDAPDGAYSDISGATGKTYVLTASELGKYIKVRATGTGSYIGAVTSDATAQVKTAVTAVTISGTAQAGEVLTGAAAPPEATVTYQWLWSDAPDGAYSDISGATGQTFTPGFGLVGKYIKVRATGTGSYIGAATSDATAQVKTAVTAVTISGAARVGEALTGAAAPPEATVAYQWQWSDAPDGAYSDISGATGNTYVLTASELGRYIKVRATGTGPYTGAATSDATGQVTQPVTAIGAISGILMVGSTLTAGAITPPGATVTYQWQWSDAPGGTYSDISGATGNTYVLTASELGRYIKVRATGTGPYTGAATSDATAQVKTAVTAVTISGIAAVGETLTAGAVTPDGATVAYQWQWSDAPGGAYSDISGATGNAYALTASEFGRYIKVRATGTGSYAGAVTSDATAQVKTAVTAVTISGIAAVGETLTVGAVTPDGATVTYQWQWSDAPGGAYSDISGATGNTYALTASELGRYIKVRATGTGSYTGAATSDATAQVKTAVTAVTISGTARVGEVLTGAAAPPEATVTYQWQWSDAPGGTYSDISGATGNTYALTASELGRYIRVRATGAGPCIGAATSDATAQVTQPVTAIGAITGTVMVGGTLTAGAITPPDATVTCQWQWSDAPGGTYSDISGATGSTYALTASELGRYIKVRATGTGPYTGAATSDATAQVTQPVTAIGTITGTVTVGSTLTAGATTPPDATVTYQWQVAADIAGPYTDIAGATQPTYTIPHDQNMAGKCLQVRVTGTGATTGSATSASTAAIQRLTFPTAMAFSPASGTHYVGSPATPALAGRHPGASIAYAFAVATSAATVDAATGLITVNHPGSATLRATQTHPDYNDITAVYTADLRINLDMTNKFFIYAVSGHCYWGLYDHGGVFGNADYYFRFADITGISQTSWFWNTLTNGFTAASTVMGQHKSAYRLVSPNPDSGTTLYALHLYATIRSRTTNAPLYNVPVTLHHSGGGVAAQAGENYYTPVCVINQFV